MPRRRSHAMATQSLPTIATQAPPSAQSLELCAESDRWKVEAYLWRTVTTTAVS